MAEKRKVDSGQWTGPWAMFKYITFLFAEEKEYLVHKNKNKNGRHETAALHRKIKHLQ